jgi:Kef-type K+ transport system membrane component KefB
VTSSTDSFVLIAGLLLLAKTSGGIATRLGMPSVLGMIIAGLIAGPAVLGWVGDNAFVGNLSQVGVVLLMFIAGLETDPVGLRSVGRSAFFVAVGGVVLPLAAGYGVGLLSGMSTGHALFLGAILTATSVSITAETLKELGRARSREGVIILGAAVIDDVLGVLVLSGLVVAESGGSLVVPLLKLALFGGLAFAMARWVMPRLVEHHTRLESDDTRVALVLGMCLVFAWAAYKIGGLADVTGAFLAGVMISRTDLGHAIMAPVARLGYSLFIPIFFVFIGSYVTAHDLLSAPLLCTAVIVVALVTKLVGCGAAAAACRESMPASLRIGAGMVGRGEIALVVASVGLREGLVDQSVFSIAIVMTVVTTIAAPLMLKAAYVVAPSRQPAESPSVLAAGYRA